ncbi:hypothetical protein JW756_06515 [Candidatus Woesearchaeota archaeon]|nr:hypothetical protein [Candidatus Woesearchaeota archaeon]
MAKHSGHEHKEHVEHHEHKEDSSGSEGVNLDFSKVKNFFSVNNQKRNAVLLTTVLLLIPIILTFIIRIQPQYLPATDRWAENSVDNYFMNQIANSINSQYPNLPEQNKQTLISQQFEAFKKNNAQNFRDQVAATSAYFKTGFQYQENNISYTFLGDLDSYFFLRQARNLVQKGTICDEFRNGSCYDNHMLAPIGTPLGRSMHSFAIYYLYNVLHALNPSINLMQSSFLLPTVIAVLATIAAFFIGKKIMNQTAGFFGAMFLAISPIFLSRTLGSDSDIWNIAFPLIILWIFLEAFEAKSLVKKSILSVLTGILFGLFSFAWHAGWWYIFDFLIVVMIAYLAFQVIRSYRKGKNWGKALWSEETKSTLLILAIIVAVSVIFVTLFMGFPVFKYAWEEPLFMLRHSKAATNISLWPNIITTVAEMNAADISTIVGQTSFGLNFLFSFALLGIVLTLVSKKPNLKEGALIVTSAIIFLLLTSKSGLLLSTNLFLFILMLPVAAGVIMLLIKKDEKGEEVFDIKPAVLLTIWFVGMIFSSTRGVRFISLVAPAFAIAIGVTLGYIYQWLSTWISKEFKISKIITRMGIFIILCLILWTPVKAGIGTAQSFTPSMTRGWWDSLSKINQEAAPDAIINSWWDFGHWFKYVADRKVTLDGASQNHPNAHWLGRILQTDDEKEAIAIMRMLDCGSNNAFEEVNKKYQDTEISQNIIKEILRDSKEDAKAYLLSLEFTAKEADDVLSFTHCDPPENYFITSEDMVGKSGVWAHFGLWDFDRAWIINNIRPLGPVEGIALLQERFNYSEDEASRTYYDVQSLQSDREMNDWISPWPSYFTTNWGGCQEANLSSENNETNIPGLVCSVNRGISENNGVRTVIDFAVLNLDNYEASHLIAGAYDTATGFRRGSGRIIPSSFILLGNDTIERVKMENVSFPYDVLLDTVNKQALMVDPHISESIFTKLFYLEGRYTEHFEKFSDITDITGARIIVWKVKW